MSHQKQQEFDFSEPDYYTKVSSDYLGSDTVTLLTDTSTLLNLSSITSSSNSYGSCIPSSWNSTTSGTFYTTNTTSTIGISNSGTGTSIGPNPIWTTGPISNPGLVVDGDIKWNGRSLGKLLEKIEDRLAMLTEPTPERLERFAALREAYEAYKLLDTLCGDDKKESK
jgi:hypothetical protein